jgi:hypothetical protein
MGAAIEFAACFHPVADDPAITVGAGWSKRMNRAFKAVENMRLSCHLHLERFVVIVSAQFTRCHGGSFQ